MRILDERSIIGNYRVIRLLGQGGMGTVYEVEHLELGTHYALKTFTFDSEDQRTWREVAANQRKHRYRFDLQRKNVTAKCIRIGREPGFMKDHFSLDKILVYGKEK